MGKFARIGHGKSACGKQLRNGNLKSRIAAGSWVTRELTRSLQLPDCRLLRTHVGFVWAAFRARSESRPPNSNEGGLRLTLETCKTGRQESSQICEMLLKIGVDEYDKEGHKYLQKTMTSTREED
jgi:hypothetical protein